MRSRNRFHPSPAMVVAVLALVAAAAGVAIANPIAKSSKKSKGVSAKKVRSIATSVASAQIATQAPGLSVANAANATNATNAGHASSATTAGSANPIAFAHVSSDGVVDPAQSKTLAQSNVTQPDAGVGFYCFSNLGFSFKGAEVTVDYDDSFGPITPQFGDHDSSQCSPPAQAYVLFLLGDDSGTPPTGFFITFYD